MSSELYKSKLMVDTKKADLLADSNQS